MVRHPIIYTEQYNTYKGTINQVGRVERKARMKSISRDVVIPEDKRESQAAEEITHGKNYYYGTNLVLSQKYLWSCQSYLQQAPRDMI